MPAVVQIQDPRRVRARCQMSCPERRPQRQAYGASLPLYKCRPLGRMLILIVWAMSRRYRKATAGSTCASAARSRAAPLGSACYSRCLRAHPAAPLRHNWRASPCRPRHHCPPDRPAQTGSPRRSRALSPRPLRRRSCAPRNFRCRCSGGTALGSASLACYV